MLKRPASAFRHLTPQSKTSASQDRNGSPYSGTGLVPASAFFLSGTGLTGLPATTPAFQHLQKQHTKKEKGTPCMSTLLLMVLNLLYDVKNSYVHVGMPRKSESDIGIFIGSQLRHFDIGIPARISPTLPSCDNDHVTHYILKLYSYYLLLIVNPLTFRI